LRCIQGELKLKLKVAKEEYGKKVEQKLLENNMKDVWEGMKIITGCKKKSSVVEGDVVRANQLNQFFNRFECPAPAAMSCSTSTPHLLPTLVGPQHSFPLSCSFSQSTVPIQYHASARAASPQPAPTNAPLSPTYKIGTPLVPIITEYQVKRELSRLRQGKAAGPDGVCPRLL